MNDKEIKTLMDLAKRLQKEMTKDKALASFMSAGILNEKGDFTKEYERLNSYVSVSKG